MNAKREYTDEEFNNETPEQTADERASPRKPGETEMFVLFVRNGMGVTPNLVNAAVSYHKLK